MLQADEMLRVLHVISGDRWAGAEAQAFTLLKELKPKVILWVVLLNKGELARRLANENIQLTILDESELPAWRIWGGIKNVIHQFRPDVIHTHRQKENVLAATANALSLRTKSVRTEHGAPEFRPKGLQKMQVLMDKFCGKYMQDAVIAVSDDLALQLSKTFGGRKVKTINNGIDLSGIKTLFGRRSSPCKHSDVAHIGIIGRIERVKRLDLFLDTASILVNSSTQIQWRFHVFGDGSLYNDMKSYCSKLGLEDYCTFHGHQQDIHKHILGLDLLLMPSDHEGLPMTALEALALGVPVVAHAVGGLVKLLSGVDPDLLVHIHEPSAYANAVEKTLGKEKRHLLLEKQYTSEFNGQEVLNLYSSIVRGQL